MTVRSSDPLSFSPDEVWAEIRPGLERAIRARGLDPATAEDLAQETYIRAVKRGMRFTSSRAAARWAWKVGRDLSIDELRRRSRVWPAALVPDQPGDDELDNVIAAHERWWDHFVPALAQLSPRQLEAVVRWLFAPPPKGATKRDQDREALLRLKARRRLRELGQGPFAGVLWRLRLRLDRLADATGMAAAAVVLSTATAMTTPPPPTATVVTVLPIVNSGVDNARPEDVGAGASRPPVAPAPLSLSGPPAPTRRSAPRASAPGRVSSARVVDPAGTTDVGTHPDRPDSPFLCAAVADVDLGCMAKPGRLRL